MKFWVLFAVVTMLVFLGVWVVKNQEHLIFPGFRPNLETYQANEQYRLDLAIDDEISLMGWNLPAIFDESEHVLIYFGGNAQDVLSVKPVLEQLPVSRVYTFNYRSYGLNEGQPSEEMFYQDGLSIYEFVKAEHPNAKISVVGFSMGSAVAGYVTANKSVEKLVLICPLFSIEKIVQSQFSSFIAQYLKHRFDLHGLAPSILAPTQVFIASRDKAIPPEHSKATFDALAVEKQLTVIDGASHNSIFEDDKFLSELHQFLK